MAESKEEEQQPMSAVLPKSLMSGSSDNDEENAINVQKKKDEESLNPTASSRRVLDWFLDKTTASKSPDKMPYRYRLLGGETTSPLKKSIKSVRFAIMASAINTKMLNPNFPIMVSPGEHPDSFPDTEPFGTSLSRFFESQLFIWRAELTVLLAFFFRFGDFNSATYFLPMCSLLGVAIASIFLGQISDRAGRKKIILILSVVSTVGSILKYFARDSFWGFCIVNLIFGFFLGNLPVGMAYIGDIYTSKKAKEDELGKLVSFFVMGNSGGGIIAILMNGSGLFAPLWVGAILMAVSTVYTYWSMIEPGDARLLEESVGGKSTSKEDEEETQRPDNIDNKALFNIIAGAVADNFGSTGLFPLCLSPLALEHFSLQFTERGEDPILTITGYQWLSVCVAFMVIPSTMITPYVFKALGVGGTCVFGNVFTAVVTYALLGIGNGRATLGMLWVFIIVMYGGFPFTVFSQLTTGPMLDVIAPEDKIGYVQGLNNAAMNFGMAIAPWLFGLLADATTTNTAIITGGIISLVAALINLPLTCDERFGRAKAAPPSSKLVLPEEDEAFVQLVLQGDFVDPEKLYAVNMARALMNKSLLIPRVKTYEEDKGNMADLQRYAKEAYKFRIEFADRMLQELYSSNSIGEVTAEQFCQHLNATVYKDKEAAEEATHDLGCWVGDYWMDTGYTPHTQSVILKQMIMAAFPPIRTNAAEQEYTPEILEDSMLRHRNVMTKYLGAAEKVDSKFRWSTIMGTNGNQISYS
jgi:MFS family permease